MSIEVDFSTLLRGKHILSGEHLGAKFKGEFLEQSEKSVLLDVKGKINWYPKYAINFQEPVKGSPGVVAGKDLVSKKQDNPANVIGENEKPVKTPENVNSETNNLLVGSVPVNLDGIEKATESGEEIIKYLQRSYFDNTKPFEIFDICDTVGKTIVSLMPVLQDLQRIGLIKIQDKEVYITDLGRSYTTGKPREIKKLNVSITGEVAGTKRERVEELLKRGVGKLQIARLIKCSRAYPGIVEKRLRAEEKAKEEANKLSNP